MFFFSSFRRTWQVWMVGSHLSNVLNERKGEQMRCTLTRESERCCFGRHISMLRCSHRSRTQTELLKRGECRETEREREPERPRWALIQTNISQASIQHHLAISVESTLAYKHTWSQVDFNLLSFNTAFARHPMCYAGRNRQHMHASVKFARDHIAPSIQCDEYQNTCALSQEWIDDRHIENIYICMQCI